MEGTLMFKQLIALLLISTQAFAGLPPTSVKGQSDATSKVNFNFQAPHNQFTNLGGIKTLIETGNTNILPDPGFEGTPSGWTFSGGATATTNSTAKGTGALGADWDSNSAGQTLVSTSVTIPNGYQGKNGFFSCNIKTVSGTATHTISVNDGTNDISAPFTIPNSTTSFISTYNNGQGNFVYPSSGTIRIKLTSVNANEPEIYIDDCKISLADNLYQITPTIFAFATNTAGGSYTAGNVFPFTNVIVDNYGGFSSGTYTVKAAGTYTVSTGIYSNTSSTASVSVKKNGTTIAQGFGVQATFAAQTLFVTPVIFDAAIGDTITVTGSATVTLDAATREYWVSIQGVPQSQQAVSSAQADYDWTAYTPTITGAGTPTSVSFLHRRIGSTLEVKGTFVTGTVSAVLATVTLPNGNTIDTTKTTLQNISSASGANVGDWIGAGASNLGAMVTATGTSSSLVYFATQIAAANMGIAGNGNTVWGTGQTVAFKFSVPITGWSSNQRAPTLIGSVTSNSTSALRMEAARVTCGNSGSAINASTGTSPNWTATNGGSAGLCTVNFLFTSEPVCQCTIIGTQSILADSCLITSTPTATALVLARNIAGAATNGDIEITCIGNR